MKPETVEKITQMPEWKEVHEYMEQCVNALNTHIDIKPDATPEQRNIEIIGRQRAMQMLGAILEPFKVQEPEPIKSDFLDKKHGL
jgi:hypothetical protein